MVSMAGYIFGYGTLIPKYYQENNVVAEIEGYKRIYHTSSDYYFWYPFVIKKSNYRCKGILIPDKDGSLLASIDGYESYPELYDRIQVPVTVVSDPEARLADIDPASIKAWLYVPSTKTLSLKLDRIFKQMKKHDMDAYKDMMEKDLWIEKLRLDHPEIVQVLPALFGNGAQEPVPGPSQSG